MATLTPRASRLWTDSVRMSYFDTDLEADGDNGLGSGAEVLDGRTPLDRTIDRIGMGSVHYYVPPHNTIAHVVPCIGKYHWILLSLCGFGAWYIYANQEQGTNHVIPSRRLDGRQCEIA